MPLDEPECRFPRRESYGNWEQLIGHSRRPVRGRSVGLIVCRPGDYGLGGFARMAGRRIVRAYDQSAEPGDTDGLLRPWRAGNRCPHVLLPRGSPTTGQVGGIPGTVIRWRLQAGRAAKGADAELIGVAFRSVAPWSGPLGGRAVG